MKTPYKFLSIAFISTFIFGCSSTSVQNVAKPDINHPINENETIIQLKHSDLFFPSTINALVVANNKSIGELANGDELVWKTNSNSFECISLTSDSILTLMDGIKLDDTPNAYKCFETKPKAMMTLTYDIFYPAHRMVREVSFTPIFKLSPTFDRSTKVTVNVINSISSDAQNEKNIKAILENAVKKQFGDNFSLTSNKAIDIEILEYKTGNAATRWVLQSMDGSTFVKVKVIIKEDEQIVETFITRPVISRGGGFSVGADEYIFDEVAEDIYLYLFGNK